MKRIIVVCFIVGFSLVSVWGQTTNFTSQVEEDFKLLFDSLFRNDGIKFTQTDSVKLQLSEEIADLLQETLSDEEIFAYPFDSIKYWGIRFSKDKKLKIYNWNIKLSTGVYKYYGFVQYHFKDSLYSYRLKDVFKARVEQRFLVLRNGDWIGGNYYDIVDFELNGTAYYMLLGARHNGYLSKFKMIDILSFPEGKIRLGKSVFYGENMPLYTRRMLFEYSHYINMSLHYDAALRTCIFDQLMPETPDLEGQNRFYTPSGAYNSLTLTEGKWLFKENITARNKKNKLSKLSGIKSDSDSIYTPSKKKDNVK